MMTADTPPPIALRQPGATRILARCLIYLRPYWYFTAISYLLLLINSGITLFIPQLIRSVVDRGIRQGQIDVIQRGALGLLALVLIKGLFTYLSGRWTEIASQNVAYDLRNDIHDKLQSLSFSYHVQAETGQFLARAVGDVDRLRVLTRRANIRP